MNKTIVLLLVVVIIIATNGCVEHQPQASKQTDNLVEHATLIPNVNPTTTKSVSPTTVDNLSSSTQTASILNKPTSDSSVTQAVQPVSPTKTSNFVTPPFELWEYLANNVIQKCVTFNGVFPSNNYSGTLVVSRKDKDNKDHPSLLVLATGKMKSLLEMNEVADYNMFTSIDNHWFAYRTWKTVDYPQNSLILLSQAGQHKLVIPFSQAISIIGWAMGNRLLIFRSDNPKLWVLNPFNQSEQYISTNFPEIDNSNAIAWGGTNWAISPDLSRVVYQMGDKQGQGKRLFDLFNKTTLLNLRHSLIAYPAVWSPNGSEFIHTTYAIWDDTNLKNVNLFGVTKNGEETNLTNLKDTPDQLDLWDYSWSPTGDKIAFWSRWQQSSGYLNILETKTGKIITTCIASGSGFHNFPIWSTDGKQIAFRIYGDTSLTPNLKGNLAIVNLDEGTGFVFPEDLRPIGWLIP